MAVLEPGSVILGIDTCGAAGSVALGRVVPGTGSSPAAEEMGLTPLAGGEYAARLVAAIADLLDGHGLSVGDLGGIVAVAGPGSFTGIRIGLAAAKAFSEAAGLPVVTVSRLALLASVGKSHAAVLDAHRGQMYFGIGGAGSFDESLMTAGEVNAQGGLPSGTVVCEEALAQLIEETLIGDTAVVRVPAPTALDAIRFSLEKWQRGELADVAALDGHYLRGADAKLSAVR